MFIMSKDPNLLESDDIVVRICEFPCNALDAFCQALRYILETPVTIGILECSVRR